MKTFKYLSPDSKVWIYQASRPFTAEEHTLLKEELIGFCKEWTAHNKQLTADFDIVYDRFVVLVVDETGHSASGCSIDKSVHFLKDMGERFGIDFFDKLQIPYLHFGQVQTLPYAGLKHVFKAGEIDEDTRFFDTSIVRLEDYNKGFLKPLKEHWLNKKLEKVN